MMQIPGLETYFGGKGGEGVAQTIINHIPPHTVYIEGFLKDADASGAICKNTDKIRNANNADAFRKYRQK